jgi:hypothetical protein
MQLFENADTWDLESFKKIMKEAAEHYCGTHEALESPNRVINARMGGEMKKQISRFSRMPRDHYLGPSKRI